MVSNPPPLETFPQWITWCKQHLKFVEEKIPPNHSFENFCVAVSINILCFQEKYKTEKDKSQLSDHRKRDMETLRNALKKASNKGVFSGQLPELFIQLLIKSCDTDCCYNYKKGTTAAVKCEVEFIAELANRHYLYTDKPFEYGHSNDLLHRSTELIFKRLGLSHDKATITNKIKKHIRVTADKPFEYRHCNDLRHRSAKITLERLGLTHNNAIKEHILASGQPTAINNTSRSFSYSELEECGASPAKLPDDFTFAYATTSITSPIAMPETNKRFKHSLLAKNINDTPLPSAASDLLDPDLCLWLQYVSEQLCEAKNNRAKLLCELATNNLKEEEVATLYTKEGPLCKIALQEFKKRGDLYNPQEVLDFIITGVQLIFCNEKSEDRLFMNADTIPKENTVKLIEQSLELQCIQFEGFEPRLIDFIPMGRPATFGASEE